MSYEYPRLKLTRDPLSLVLCQIRFSAIRKMPDFIPEIQNRLRRKGFPNDASGQGQAFVITQGSEGAKADAKALRRDEFRSKDECWAVVIAPESLALVTSAYDRYHGFHEQLLMILQEVDAVAELHLSQIHRLGIRYIDVINPQEGETFRDYLKEPLHGLQTDVFLDNAQVIQSQTIGRTRMGTFSIRIWQNDQGHLVPPDLLQGKPMPMRMNVGHGRLITLVDSDHFVEGAWDYNVSNVLSTLDGLHQGMNRVWFNDVIKPHALHVWGATNA